LKKWKVAGKERVVSKTESNRAGAFTVGKRDAE